MQPIAEGRPQAPSRRRAAGRIHEVAPHPGMPELRVLPEPRAFERTNRVAQPIVRAPDRAAVRPPRPECSLDQRALALWPRLDRRALTRCGCDAGRIARYVARRTSLPLDSIVAMLTEP